MKKIGIIWLLAAQLVQAQPRLAGALAGSGTKQGGSLFRSDLPGIAPDTIHVFNNLNPRTPTGGVVRLDGWLYGLLQVDSTGPGGALYRVHENGTGFQVLARPGSNGTPTVYSDGNIYYSSAFELHKYKPASNEDSVINLPDYTVQRRLLIDADGWVYMTTLLNDIARIRTDGSGYTVLRTLDGPTEGSNGLAGLIEGPGDTLFSVQQYEGPASSGTLYSIRKDGSGFNLVHVFTGPDGKIPESAPVYAFGRIYGTTSQGGDYNNGVLYSVNPDGTDYRVLHSFEVTSGIGDPAGNISITSTGRIFGAFRQYHQEFIYSLRLYKVDTSGAAFEPFFNVDQRAHGHFNLDPLLVSEDTIYLATSSMGRHNGGVISRTDTSGAADEIYQFGMSPLGFEPNPLILASDGKLYGTTTYGGTSGNGTLFALNPDGSGYVRLHQFTDAEGYHPMGKLFEASDGNLYGALAQGGGHNAGALFRMNKNGSNFQVIYNYPFAIGEQHPVGSLVEDDAGWLYGLNLYGDGFYGSVFRLTKVGAGYQVLKVFNSTEINHPYGGLVLKGNTLFGTCYDGGPEGKGGVYRLNRDGTNYQVLHLFQGATDGAQPLTALLLASNGRLYGTTLYGGNTGEGTVFRIDTTGANYTILHSMTGNMDGSNPGANLIQASDGQLYGANYTATFPFPVGGSVFRLPLDGSSFDVVRSFDLDVQGGSPVGLLDLRPATVLPVNWLSFTAEKWGKQVLLKWSTAQERNSLRFEVERSSDGSRFTALGSVSAAGSSSLTSSYTYPDRNPFTDVNYYRLKQVDRDGRFTYSSTLRVQFDGAMPVLSPNPAKDELKVYMPEGYRMLTILDASGQTVLQRNLSGASVTLPLDIRSLPHGWYTVQLSGNSQTQLHFIKQ